MRLLKPLFAAVAALSFTSTALAQDFPARPLRLVVGFSAGSISDNTARVVAEQAEKALGQAIVIENVPGAGATLAAARVAKAAPDGHHLLFVAMGHAIAPVLYRKLPYDGVKDFTGVATVADARVMLVTQPRHGFKSVTDFVADAKTKPGHYSFGSSGPGTFLHLIGESLAQHAGISLLHVPYKSGSEAVTAVMGGNLDLAFCTVSTCIEQVRSGKLKALGYIAKARNPAAAEIPTFQEAGLPFDVGSYNYILAPAGTPKAVLDKLHAAFNGALAAPGVQDKFKRMGLDAVPSENAESVTRFMQAEMERWGPIAKDIGLRVN